MNPPCKICGQDDAPNWPIPCACGYCKPMTQQDEEEAMAHIEAFDNGAFTFCAHPDCTEWPTPGSIYCFIHWFDEHKHNMNDPESIDRSAPATPPPSVWQGIMARIQQEGRES